MDDQQTRFISQELLPERTLMFKRLSWALLSLIAAVFVLMLWVLGNDNPNSGNVGQQTAAGTWPDGSAKTPGDGSGSPALAQQPKATPPQQPQQQQPQPGG